MGIGRKQVVIAALIVASALGYLIVTGMRDTMVFYYTVSEVNAQLDTLSRFRCALPARLSPVRFRYRNRTISTGSS